MSVNDTHLIYTREHRVRNLSESNSQASSAIGTHNNDRANLSRVTMISKVIDCLQVLAQLSRISGTYQLKSSVRDTGQELHCPGRSLAPMRASGS